MDQRIWYTFSQHSETISSGTNLSMTEIDSRTSMRLNANEFGDSPAPYVDDSVTVTPIPISPSPPTYAEPNDPSKFSFADSFKFSTPAFEGTEEEVLAQKKVIVHEMFKKGVYSEDMDDSSITSQYDDARKRRSAITNVNLPPAKPTDITMAYFVQNCDTPGPFDVKKAKALNVPVGKLYGQLKAGESVEIPVVNEDGKTTMKTIRSEDVLGKSIPGKSILILDIPGLQYVKKVLENDVLNSEKIKNADVVVHMLSDEVASDNAYIKWMESFKKSSKVLTDQRLLTIASGHGTETDSGQSNVARTIYIRSRSKFPRRLNISTSLSRWRTYNYTKLPLKEVHSFTASIISI